MNLVIERASPDDAATLVRVQIAAFHDDDRLYPGVGLSGPPGYDSVDVMLIKICDDIAYKLVLDGQIVGGLVLIDRGDGHLHLDLLFVDPAYHNRGVGTEAMHFIERLYANVAFWTLDTPAYALRNQHFYEKFGYVKVGEQDIDGFILYAYEKRR